MSRLGSIYFYRIERFIDVKFNICIVLLHILPTCRTQWFASSLIRVARVARDTFEKIVSGNPFVIMVLAKRKSAV